ncbi:MAG TPA: hypothetical protein VNB59_04940 [Solirubrobacterales bacterium]|jgi:hypothetical protein|nr:hypothetical protein [Solirubrobacterales bacterium]
MDALLEREGKVESWNDNRLDELSGRVDNGFKEMREGFDRLDQAMREGFAEINGRIDRLMLTLLVAAIGIIGTLIGGAVF